MTPIREEQRAGLAGQGSALRRPLAQGAGGRERSGGVCGVKAGGWKDRGDLGMTVIEREKSMRGTGRLSKITRPDGTKEGEEDIRLEKGTGHPGLRASRSQQLTQCQESPPKGPSRHQTPRQVPETRKTPSRSVQARSLGRERNCGSQHPAQPGRSWIARRRAC